MGMNTCSDMGARTVPESGNQQQCMITSGSRICGATGIGKGSDGTRV